jgi:hypothetical protein
MLAIYDLSKNTKPEEPVGGHIKRYLPYSDNADMMDLKTQKIASYTCLPLEHCEEICFIHPTGKGTILEIQQLIKSSG